ncbi:hypothetical protein DICPUDRAFT_155787 [Dictyostelium purpureum]|uniref:Ras guanine nucleotide exchange factor n=1 Tax=Dictyostelium purpureum TaxID=5786 RepID=F0ZUW1_DICPU|nr:uncharacterized protein DICPUDRAFT_155787 [Dictyostelium purpureum]EGC32264.1 hypothetical protein DICPUDRAFT_155787 [Dictyostelium purpureum]|eukprot:XP_003291201.1 hypothetical protein DICPUDRAFT_155787 [Dictyostelium purpureum]
MGSKVSKLLEESAKANSKEINLKEHTLKHIPIVLCTNFSYIVKLNLNDNLIKEIPADIYKLRALKILWVNNNRITSIPDEVGLLSELEDFQVDGNNIVRIGRVFFELKKITDLSLSKNHLKEIPTDISDFKTLKSLHLEQNQLTALPGCLSSMSQLRTLNVGQNQIEYIFNDFSNIPSLTALTLFANRLNNLPDNFGRLANLANLNLRSNNLSTLPDSFHQLKSLTTLSLWDNQFEVFPISLCGCSSLTELSFSNNGLVTIPPEIKNLTKLRKLYLQYNQIETIPTEVRYLVNLNHLLLHHNRLTQIPCEISVLSKTLDSINLSGNPLPTKILQSDQQSLMRYLLAELNIRRDVSARLIQRHYRVWKKQFRFRNVVFALIETNKIQKNIVIANQTAKIIQAAIKIQRWYRSRKILNIWYELVSKVCLLLIVNSPTQSLSNIIENNNNNGNNNGGSLTRSASNVNSLTSSPKMISQRKQSQRNFLREHKDIRELEELSNVESDHDSDEEERKLREIKEQKELREINFLGEQFSIGNISSGSLGSLVSAFNGASSTSSVVASATEENTIEKKLEKQKNEKKKHQQKIISGRLGSLYGFEEPDIQDVNIIYQDSIIKAATVPKLIEHLCNIDYTEEGYSRYFFATYQSFIKAVELFQLLCVRYHIEPPMHASALELAQFKKTIKPRIQERVIDLMGYWIQNHLTNFQDDPRLLRNFNQFISNTLMLEKETSARRLIAIFNETKKKHIDNLAELIKLSQNAPKPILPLRTPDGSDFTLLDISSIEIARQMALIDQTLLSKITATELLSKKWSKCTDENQKICPNILTMIGIFNQCSKWVSSEIVGERSSKVRIKKLKFFIKIAQHCYDMQNFNGLMLIISGLSCSSVTRLRGTWGALSSHRREKFDQMERFVNMEGNFKQYRMLLSEINGTPCIPFVGLYLMDLTFIDEGNPSYIGVDLVNFVKKRLEANLILRFLSFKNVPYCFEPVAFIQNMILDSSPMSEKELYDKSVAIEKRHIRKIAKKENREKNKLTTSSVGDLATLATPYSPKDTSKTTSPKLLSVSHDPTIELNERRLKRNDTLNGSSPATFFHQQSHQQSHSSPTLGSATHTTVSNNTISSSMASKDNTFGASLSISPRPKIPILNFSVSTSISRGSSPNSSPRVQQQHAQQTTPPQQITPSSTPTKPYHHVNIEKVKLNNNGAPLSDRSHNKENKISKIELGGQLKNSISNPYISNAGNTNGTTSPTLSSLPTSKKTSNQNTSMSQSSSLSFSSNSQNSSRDSSALNSPRQIQQQNSSGYFGSIPIQPSF